MKTKQYKYSQNNSLSEKTEQLLQFCKENQESETAKNLDFWLDDELNFFILDEEIRSLSEQKIMKYWVDTKDVKKFIAFLKNY